MSPEKPPRSRSGPAEGVVGQVTRGTTNTNRLRRVDRWIARHPVLRRTDDPLVVGIIGRGHLEYGHGTPFQLRDLGVEDVAVLLPATDATPEAKPLAGIADALFRLDTPEPPQSRRTPRATS